MGRCSAGEKENEGRTGKPHQVQMFKNPQLVYQVYFDHFETNLTLADCLNRKVRTASGKLSMQVPTNKFLSFFSSSLGRIY